MSTHSRKVALAAAALVAAAAAAAGGAATVSAEGSYKPAGDGAALALPDPNKWTEPPVDA